MAAELAVRSEVVSVLRTAITVMNSESGPALCPFFGKCDGVMVFDSAGGGTAFYPNRDRTAKAMCDLLLKLMHQRLVCGFVAVPERNKLRAAGIEVRLASCTRAVAGLVSQFHELPAAAFIRDSGSGILAGGSRTLGLGSGPSRAWLDGPESVRLVSIGVAANGLMGKLPSLSRSGNRT
jgi:hypothetical protein